jgi:hypothetical protein
LLDDDESLGWAKKECIIDAQKGYGMEEMAKVFIAEASEGEKSLNHG